MNNKTKYLTMSALFAALLAVCSQIQIPLPMVPINLALFGAYLAGALLGPKHGTISVFIYVLLGASGVPVFAGFTGGFRCVIGPTGGYIIGYIIAAFAVGFLTKKLGYTWWKLSLSMIIGMMLCYIVGTIWFMNVMKFSLSTSLVYCVYPFLPGDAIKILAATFLTLRLRKTLPELMQVEVRV
ncbi:biotin transporter BioY [Anaerosporobacter faecicola]|uniref:biotin transporter BioY n=1 Tax=Anaerosporobacter faecicola TaxID=2718714 RepID=UPI00143BA661|nr:biotin transporter BioY [Anaerosporobacter faecicola]